MGSSELSGANPLSDGVVGGLREAVKLSSQNIPLREHLADTLLGAGRAAEAEREYRAALAVTIMSDSVSEQNHYTGSGLNVAIGGLAGFLALSRAQH